MKVTTQQLQAVLGNAQILRGIDFEANDGEFVGIIGPNGSGKSTQIEQLANRAKQLGKAVRQIKFPNYAEDSSALVKAYLRGELGGLHEINAYAASVLYSVDRYATW